MKTTLPLIATAALLLGPVAPSLAADDSTTTAPASAAPSPSSDRWQYDAALYLWGASIGGTSASGGDIDISFKDLVSNLNFAGMGIVRANKQKWSIEADLIYLNASDKNDGNFNLPGPLGLKVDTDSDVSMKSWVITPSLAYTLLDSDRLSVQGLAGARFLWIETSVKLTAGGPLGNAQKVSVSESDHVWDGIVGAKGQLRLTDSWFVPYYADVGTGQSDLTYQLFSGVGYQFDRVDAILGWRYTKWKFDDDTMLKDLDLNGPMAGLRYRF